MKVYVATVESAHEDDTGVVIGVGLSYHGAVSICERHACRPMVWCNPRGARQYGSTKNNDGYLYCVTPYEAEP